jgi:TolA-binding protein
VSPYILPRALLPVLLTGILALILPSPGLGLEISWGFHPDRERVVLHFEGKLPQELPRRAGSRELVLVSAWPGGESRPAPFHPHLSTLIESLEVTETGVTLRTRTESFGYLSFTLPGENKLVVEIFPDELGSRWTPEPLRLPGEGPGQPVPGSSAVTTESALPRIEGSPALPLQPAGDPVPGQPMPETAEIASMQAEPAVEQPSSVPAQPRDDPQALEAGQVHIRAKARQVGPREAPVINPGSGSEPREALSLTPKQMAADPSVNIEETPPGPTNGSADKHGGTALFEEGKFHLDRGEWVEAAAKLEGALTAGLGPGAREQAAYGVAESLYMLHGTSPGGNFERMIRALQRAMNIGPDSPDYPHALYAAGDIQLKVGNEPEARAYFTLLRKHHPDHPDVPRSYLSWGLHFLGVGQWEKSAQALQTVVETYPQSDVVREAAVALVKALKEGGYFDQAFEISTFVDRRWPRYYMEDHEFLRLEGIIALEMGKFELARRKLWTNYNLVPEAPGADLVMARLGDIYLLQGLNEVARQTYELTALKHPDQEGGLIATMRLAEQGIFDAPSVVEMFSIFDRPVNVSPQEIYTRITGEFPDSPLAAVAQLKLAMWLLWKGRSGEAIDAVASLRKRFPDADLWPRGLEVAGKGFEKWVEEPLKAGRFDDILAFWNRYPFLRDTLPSLDAEAQLAMALTFWTTGSLDKSQEICERVMEDRRFADDDRSTAFGLYLTIAADRQQWKEIVTLGERGSVLPLLPEDQSQLRYATALAGENLGKADGSGSEWESLATDMNLKPTQQGFAYFFLGRHAQSRKDMDRAYHFTQQALSLFLREGREKGRIRDCLDQLIVISEQTGRTMKALEWAHEYAKLLPENDPDWPSFQYRLARLYRAGGDEETWRKILTSLKDKFPGGIYGKMAATDLREEDLDQRTRSFR